MEFGPGIVQADDFLTPAECAEISRKVLSLEKHWEPRLGPYRFATLGCAAYLDGEGDYGEKAAALNELMRDTFQETYEKVRIYFESILEGEVYYDEAYAYPGFHLFHFDGQEISRDRPADRAHFDYQFAKVFPNFASTTALPITFTIPVEEPSTGSSLEMWELRPEGHAELGYEHKEYAHSTPSKTVPYALGRIFSHDGLNLHAMGQIPAGTTGRRMTLQGHAFRTERGWQLYW
ncbi:hypothetical protein ABS71_18745 [bacterium SCN 62-11]|nr:hypothetical protein [Candidatus Eremiobacteraeota bacterium]ODT58647.1 MAG: hypothetical protein ABS71_18745 [bacterium SCN 62-11]